MSTASLTVPTTPTRSSAVAMTLRYTGLEAARALRNRRYLVFTVVMPLVFFLLWANLFGNDGTGRGSTKAYLMTSMAGYGCLTAAVSAGGRIAVERASGWNRQLRLTALPPWSYLVGKVATSMLIAIPSILLVFLAGRVIEGVRLPASAWLLAGVCTWLALIPFAALGVVIGYLAGPDAAQAMIPVFSIGLSLLGGLWIPVTVMPHWMAQAARAFPSYWLGDLARSALASTALSVTAVLVLAAWTAVLGALAVRLFRRETARGW